MNISRWLAIAIAALLATACSRDAAPPGDASMASAEESGPSRRERPRWVRTMTMGRASRRPSLSSGDRAEALVCRAERCGCRWWRSSMRTGSSARYPRTSLDPDRLAGARRSAVGPAIHMHERLQLQLDGTIAGWIAERRHPSRNRNGRRRATTVPARAAPAAPSRRSRQFNNICSR